MDPEANLKELRQITERALDEQEVDAVRMAELFQALDQWITRGGFLPRDWKK